MSSSAAALATPTAPSVPLTRKALTADPPTGCPGCGDFAVLAAFYKTLEKLQIPHENIVLMAGIGCSSRFPYFVNTYGGHYRSEERRVGKEGRSRWVAVYLKKT